MGTWHLKSLFCLCKTNYLLLGFKFSFLQVLMKNKVFNWTDVVSNVFKKVDFTKEVSKSDREHLSSNDSDHLNDEKTSSIS